MPHKPRLVFKYGVWFCYGLGIAREGRTFTEAYDRWLLYLSDKDHRSA